MRAVVLDSPELRALGRDAAREVGPGPGSPVAYYARDVESSVAFLIVDGAGARQAADFIFEGPVRNGPRGELWAELTAISQEAE